jgi:hypothetical protein
MTVLGLGCVRTLRRWRSDASTGLMLLIWVEGRQVL